MLYNAINKMKKTFHAIVIGLIRLWLLKELVGSWKSAIVLYWQNGRTVNAIFKWLGI